MKKKTRIPFYAILVISSIVLVTGCGSTSGVDKKGVNLACAFVEGYLETKVLSLKYGLEAKDFE